MKAKGLHICIVDDHSLFRMGTRQSLEKCDSVGMITEACDGLDMIKQFNKLMPKIPDIIFVDLSMPNMDGFETIKWVKENYPNVKIIVMSMHSTSGKIVKALTLGANSYLIKSSATDEIIKEAIKSVDEKGNYYSENIISVAMNSLQNKNDLEDDESKIKKLSDMEKKIIKLMYEGLTTVKIAEKLGKSNRTIEKYREYILQKLEIESQVGLGAFAQKNGLLN